MGHSLPPALRVQRPARTHCRRGRHAARAGGRGPAEPRGAPHGGRAVQERAAAARAAAAPAVRAPLKHGWQWILLSAEHHMVTAGALYRAYQQHERPPPPQRTVPAALAVHRQPPCPPPAAGRPGLGWRRAGPRARGLRATRCRRMQQHARPRPLRMPPRRRAQRGALALRGERACWLRKAAGKAV